MLTVTVLHHRKIIGQLARVICSWIRHRHGDHRRADGGVAQVAHPRENGLAADGKFDQVNRALARLSAAEQQAGARARR